MNLTLAEFGFGEISLAQVKQYVGNGSLNYCRRALDYFGADKEALLEPVSRRYAELFQQHCGYRVEPYEGMREALAFLSSRGAKLAVLSNKPQSRTEDNIYGAFGRELFEAVRGGQPGIPLKPDPSSLLALLRDLKKRGIRVGVVSNKAEPAVKALCEAYFPGLIDAAAGGRPDVPKKPAPDAVLRALRELGVRAEETVYVGDSEVDVETAENAGLRLFAVGWGFRTPGQLFAAGAREAYMTADSLASALMNA